MYNSTLPKGRKSKMKDELISGAELAKRLKVSAPYITKQKKMGKLSKCMSGNKYYYEKSCKALGKNPQSKTNQDTKEDITTVSLPTDLTTTEAITQLEKIIKVINDDSNVRDRALLDGMKSKATMLKEYFLAKNEEIRNRKLEENLFSRDEVIQVLSAAMSMIRNQMINMPNNYAVNLENADKTTIKEYVTDDINKMLSDLQAVGKQFEK